MLIKCKNEVLGYLIIIIWATSFPFMKEILNSTNNNYLTVVFLYNLISAAIALSISFFTKEYKKLKNFSNKRLVSSLIFLNGLYDFLVVAAISLATNVQHVIIANYIWPILLVVFISFKSGNIPFNQVLGCILGFTAVFFIIDPFQKDFIYSLYNVIAVSLGCLAAVFWALYSVLLKEEHRDIAITIQGLSQLFSMLLALGFSYFFSDLNISDALNTKSIVLITIYSTINMSFAYILWILFVSKQIEMGKLASTFYILPVLSIIFSNVWFGVETSASVFIAISLIILGIHISRKNI